MTHRGPFQPLPFCDSMIKFSKEAEFEPRHWCADWSSHVQLQVSCCCFWRLQRGSISHLSSSTVCHNCSDEFGRSQLKILYAMSLTKSELQSSKFLQFVKKWKETATFLTSSYSWWWCHGTFTDHFLWKHPGGNSSRGHARDGCLL